ncbi:hypothetical protein JMN32_24130 [Fulvivirga sp. 29W222]|uniref:Outer membrane protein beta-barrel domain-containing protein n=1 Tax=Fulvivirga marina TaxID=2494733 RepID=A0A937G2D9_9BACT|nr:hypothetical protein [Fulvivirga marina]MBL6449422.1 hypothetical protein [Fulvivirga marina]
MEMQDKTQFEKEWENAFADAEMDVSASVWERVELGVSQSSAGKYKRRLLLFQLLAAASVVFAMSVGGVAVYHLQLNDLGADDSELARWESGNRQEDNIGRDAQGSKQPESNAIEESGLIDDEDQVTKEEQRYLTHEGKVSRDLEYDELKNYNLDDDNKEGSHESYSNSNNSSSVNKAGIASGAATTNEHVKKNARNVDDHDLGQGTNVFALSEDGYNTDVEAGVNSVNGDAFDSEEKSLMASNQINQSELPEKLDRLFEYLETAPLEDRELNMVPWYSYVPSKKKNNANDNLWAGVGFSAGSFNPNMGGGNVDSDMGLMETSRFNVDSKRAPSFGKEKAGQSYNVGVNFGTRLSEKWVLQSGVIYAQQETTSTSNVVSTSDQGSVKTLSNFTDIDAAEDVTFTAPYDVNNTYELVSVPIQAGYVLLDNKFNIVLLSGIANNILLKNQISATSGDIEDVNISAGSESQYRTYQISGLLGSEFSYDFGSRYRLAIIPQVKQSISSITKSESEYTSRPTTLEIGFRFKYVFNN